MTYQSTTGEHHKGADVGPDLRYTSTIQDEFRDNNDVKLKELERLKVIEDAKKSAGQFYGYEVMGYSCYDKKTLPLLTGQFNEREGPNYA